MYAPAVGLLRLRALFENAIHDQPMAQPVDVLEFQLLALAECAQILGGMPSMPLHSGRVDDGG